MRNGANSLKPALRNGVAAAALLATALLPWNLDSFAHNSSAMSNAGAVPASVILGVSAAASGYVLVAMKDPEDEIEDAIEDALDDLEDAMEDALDEDHSGSGGGGEFDDDFDDELDEDHSGSGGGGDEEDFEGDEPDEDNSGSGGGEDDDEDDHSGSGGGEDDEDDEDRSGSNSGSDDDDDDDGDRSGRHGGRDDDDDRSGSNSSSDHEDELDYSEITDDDGFLAADRELLILVERDDLERGDLRDADTEIEYELPALDLVMLRVRVAEDDDMFSRLSELEVSLGKDAVDLNHSYTTDAVLAGGSALPASLAQPLGLVGGGPVGLRIGIIDSGVDLSHRSLASAAITVRNFASRGGPVDNAHGTMIAAIIAGYDPGAYQGIAPGSEILAANIFFSRADGTAVANVEGMILALDWLVGAKVPVINMSVSGPPNRLLKRAIDRAAAAGMMIVAAVGNAGPAAAPQYPAAYDRVVAVTAIDSAGQIYRRAVRGPHVEFSAPGVDVSAATLTDAGAGGYQLQSGTSLAVPFVSVALAVARQRDQRPWAAILSEFHAQAQDLGAAGFDPVFGYGLIRGLGAATEGHYQPAGE